MSKDYQIGDLVEISDRKAWYNGKLGTINKISNGEMQLDFIDKPTPLSFTWFKPKELKLADKQTRLLYITYKLINQQDSVKAQQARDYFGQELVDKIELFLQGR